MANSIEYFGESFLHFGFINPFTIKFVTATATTATTTLINSRTNDLWQISEKNNLQFSTFYRCILLSIGVKSPIYTCLASKLIKMFLKKLVITFDFENNNPERSKNLSSESSMVCK